jgi:tetratricopeptide (TPR) repeat protein
MPRPIKKRAQKSKGPETDIDSIMSRVDGMSNNKIKKAIIAVVVVLVLALAIFGNIKYKASQQEKLANLQYMGYKYLTGADEFGAVLDSSQKALEAFTQAKAIERTPYNMYYLGVSQAKQGSIDEATATFEELLSAYPADSIYVSKTLFKLGALYMNNGDNDKSLEYFTKLGEMSKVPYQDLALVESARILESMGKTDESKEKYDTLIVQFPLSVYIDEALTKTGQEIVEEAKEATPLSGENTGAFKILDGLEEKEGAAPFKLPEQK